MDKDGIYLSPLSILKITCQEYEKSYGDREKYYYVDLHTKEREYNGSTMRYRIVFNLTEKGFKIKKEIDDLIEKLLGIIRNPITCGAIIKLTHSEFNHYNIEII